MSSESKTQDWSKPAAMAIPKGGYFQDKVEQGRYGPIFPKTPASYGFSILAKIITGREDVFYKYAKSIEETIAAQPDALAVLQLHYLRWVLFPIKGDTYFMYQGISTPISISIPKTRSRCSESQVCGLCSKIWRISRQIGKRIPPPSSSLFAIINARAFLNTQNIRMRAPLKSRRRSN